MTPTQFEFYTAHKHCPLCAMYRVCASNRSFLEITLFLPSPSSLPAGKEKADKTFAFSYFKIMNDDGSILKDGCHELYVYKAEAKRLHEPRLYLTQASCKEDVIQHRSQKTLGASTSVRMLGETGGVQFARSFKESIQVSTLVCSTKLTQKSEYMPASPAARVTCFCRSSTICKKIILPATLSTHACFISPSPPPSLSSHSPLPPPLSPPYPSSPPPSSPLPSSPPPLPSSPTQLSCCCC